MIRKITVSRLLATSLLVSSILFLSIAIWSPHLLLVILTCAVLAFSIISVILSLRKRRVEELLKTLDTAFDLFLGDTSDHLKTALSYRKKIEMATRLTETLRLIGISGIIISGAFLLLTFLMLPMRTNLANLQPNQSSTISTPISSFTPTPTQMPVMIVSTATTIFPIAQSYNISTSFDINWSITNSFPITVFTVPHIRLLREYQDLISELVPRVAIVQVTYNETESDFADEYIILANYGEPVDMSGWYILDNKNEKYTFKNFSMGSGDAAYLHINEGKDSEFHLYWKDKMDSWDQEPSIILFNQFAAVVDEWYNNTFYTETFTTSDNP